MAKTRITLWTILIVLTFPAMAAAHRSHPGHRSSNDGLPSNNAGAYQYTESIPTAGGPKADGTVRAGSNGSGYVPPATQRSLLKDGSNGRAAYLVDAASGPKSPKPKPRNHQSRRPPVGAVASPPSPPRGGLPSGTGRPRGGLPSGTGRPSAVLGAVTGLGGVGSDAALLIVLIAIVACGAALRLRRRSTD